jgi:hypothetical protein
LPSPLINLILQIVLKWNGLGREQGSGRVFSF